MSPTKTKLDLAENYASWLTELTVQYPKINQALLAQACKLAASFKDPAKLIFRQDPFDLGLAIADELLSLNCDSDCVAAAVLYPTAIAHQLSNETIINATNVTVAKLIQGAITIENLQATQDHKSAEAKAAQADKLRKMVLAVVDDLRVVLLKLAERLIALKHLRHATPNQQKTAAHEVMTVYAPLANRLGLGQLKWQLEDWSFRYLDRQAYEDIFKVLKQRREEREAHVAHLIEKLTQLVESTHIESVKINGRAKHIYSIYRKLVNKQLTMDKLYDMIALRVLVPTLQDCYAVLGIVHSSWKHIQSEFDDYIAHPKANGYRSIHTAIMDETQHPVEVQIRTYAMHEEAELGVAAHWVYKEGSSQPSYENKINVLRTLFDWQKELNEDSRQLSEQLLNDHVYVFTPNGDVIDLDQGATPLDFAYHIHTELGHNCRGAKVNGVLVPLSYSLKTGDQVSVLTTKNGHPSRDWLRDSNGYLKTTRAKQKVAAWFKKQSTEEHIAQGQQLWEKACRHKIIHKQELAKALKHFNFKNNESLMAAIGAGDLKIGTIFNYLGIEHPDYEIHAAHHNSAIKISAPKKAAQSSIIIEGVGNLFTQIARCCKPIPGDSIVGYITRDRGVTIHQKTCGNISHALINRAERVLQVQWEQQLAQRYAIDLIIETTNRSGISRDVSNIIANEKIILTHFTTHSDESRNNNLIHLTVEVENLEIFQQLLKQLQQLPDVLEVRRK
ncbi:MAG TPA: RelA/SpoT family protein [Coxiellaceae bacterium]|nr:RelA/SpoT family protein [Coxiellaceae bacterium]